MLTEEQLCDNVQELKSLNGGRIAKYRRNYRKYSYTPYISLESIRSPNVVGYWQDDESPEDDTSSTPQLNVIKSCVDTLTSKIAQSKVRPYFNCVNGTFKDIQIVNQVQQYFDQYFDEQNVNKTVSEAFRAACIFDTGWVYANPLTKQIMQALPWQVFFRPSEMTYNKFTRIYYEQKDYPTVLLPDFIKIDKDEIPYCTFGTYYDTVNHTVAYYCDQLEQLRYILNYESDTIPFIPIHFNTPVAGASSQSIVDMLYSLQTEIDILMSKIKDASQLNPAMTFFVPDGSGIKASQLNNRIGNIVTYKATPNMTASPVTVSTPSFIDQQYIQLIDELKQNAYDMVGISQLSAQSRKPAGLNSGVSLQTMEDIESDRFETQLNQVIRCYVQIAKTCIRVFNPDENVLPKEKDIINIKWKEIVKEQDRMTIQFSGADSLSKDPSTKLQQLQALAQAGVIPSSHIAQFMEIPDINRGYSMSNNAINAVLSVIDDCINNDSFEVPEYIPFTMLKEEIINTQLSLRASNYQRNKDDIEKLTKLYEIVEDKEKGYEQAAGVDENGNPVNVLTQEATTQQAGAQNAQPGAQNQNVATPQIDNTAMKLGTENSAWNGK
ncbi:Uncharacterised protein [uncultured archaeon]|nr:Uncharacterised protein [uncultured archaeon]